MGDGYDDDFGESARIEGELDNEVAPPNAPVQAHSANLRRVFKDVEKDLENLLNDTDERPEPALVDGAPMQVGKLPDGRPIYVAANKQGEPWKDGNGNWVVIDPQNGRIRFKLARRPEQNIAPMKDIDNHKLAVNQLKVHDPSFIAWAKAKASDVHPVQKKRFAQKVHAVVERVVITIVLGVAGILTRFVKLMSRIYRFFKKDEAVLKIELLPGVEQYLNEEAKVLLKRTIPSTLYAIAGRGVVGVAQYASIRVPLDPDGTINEEYIKRWANFLNDMAIKGVWRYGTLAPPSTIQLAMVNGMRWEKVLFTFIFTDGEKDNKALNEQVGFDIFQVEGSMALTSDWSKFPW